MAEAIGLASGVLALATFAFQSTMALVKKVQSFQNHPKRVRDLKEELEALSVVLCSLTDAVGATNDLDLSALDLPLLKCGKACKEFEEEISKRSSRSGGSRTSFRDWAKLTYMGDDIDEFTRLLAGYKSTIIIALTDANLRKSSVTAENIDSYKALIKNATDDLEARLQSIDEKLETALGHAKPGSDSDATELQLMKEERMSTQKCLQICAHLSEHISQIQLASERSGSSTGGTDLDSIPERIAIDGLQECKNSLALTAAKLDRYMTDIVSRLVTKSKAVTTSNEELADLERLQEEWDAVRQCIDVCSKADTHLKENISIIDNYATGDAIQFMVSTEGKTIHGKNRGLGWRTRQVGGHMNDVTVQNISRDFLSVALQNNGRGNSPSKTNAPPILDDQKEGENGSEFKERYGQGFKLPPKTTADVNEPSVSTPSGLGSSTKR